ncbi:MAG: hypothetical protein CVU56_10685 [Deltaproteobacteria bacterium HGW-Deltaproteobacteria-14]|jgi:hypothetical protein|nr:MAG: hypothetical protein CVU56_10685 [Deltaproteobacteria bacterium HGW-Deltaproteobacteria-14]
MPEVFDVLFLLALPGSGKSEVRNYLTHKDPVHFHMGPTAQLDDYPYVHLQLIVDQILGELGMPQAYHWADPDHGGNGPFIDARELGGLCELLNEDYFELVSGHAEHPVNAAARLLDRFDAASIRAGARPKFRTLPPGIRAALEARLEPEARKLFDDKAANVPDSLDGKTVVIEFARGGPAGSAFPLRGGYGYEASLSHISPEILRRAAILYIWVTPEESQRKNNARAKKGEQGSILFHRTPQVVMEREYGICDMHYLLETSDVPGTIRVESHGYVFHVPTEPFDNRTDLTSFLREPVEAWSESDIGRIHGSLSEAAGRLWQSYAKSR